MQPDFISVIVPVYNIEPYVERCIRSILSQTYNNLEVIIINDGSTDNSGSICHRLALSDSRIRVIDQKNAGLSEARNTGLRIAQGTYIAFVDGDDYIDEKMYEILHKRLVQENSDLALCNISYVDENRQCIDKKRFHLGNDVLGEEAFWRGYYGEFLIPYVVSWNKLYKRELFKDIAFDKGKIHEDEFILHKIISQCKSISIINDCLYYYVQRTGSIMGSSYNIRRLQAVEAFERRLDYFAQKDMQFISPTMSRIFGVILDAKEFLDFSTEINRVKYNEAVGIYRRNFWKYIRDLNLSIVLKSMLFLSCSPVYMCLRRIKRNNRK
ncbi:MAG: glycosyltransferase [Lachnospiraceae bacterium]